MNVNGVNQTSATTSVSSSKGNTKTSKNNKANNKSSENEFVLADLLEAGTLKAKRFLGIKTGQYAYVSDGSKTYAQIKEELGLEDGALRNANYKLFDKIEGNADSVTPEKGTELIVNGQDLPSKKLDLKSENGEELDGFYEDVDGHAYYEVQYGDTQESIYKKFEDKALKDYKTADAMKGYPDRTLQAGTKVDLPKKGFFGRLLSGIFG